MRSETLKSERLPALLRLWLGLTALLPGENGGAKLDHGSAAILAVRAA